MAPSRRALALAAALVAAPAPAGAADEDDPEIKQMSFAEKGASLVVTAAFTELFDRKAYQDLDKGVPSIVVLRAFVYRKGSRVPIAFTIATYRVVYDLWDEVYVVRVVDPRGIANHRFASRADALRAVTELEGFPIASLERVPIGPHHYLELVIELNPVSQELLAEMRRWLTRPAGSASLDSDSSFFGSVVSVFANPKLQAADRSLRLRSQPFYRVGR